MNLVRIKPEGFKYFHNTKSYYLSGTSLLLDENNWIPEGRGLHFFFDHKVLGDLNLAKATDLFIEVEPIAKEVISGGRLVLRFNANRIYEDDKWNAN